MVLKTINSRYALDSVKTPGLVHLNNLTQESAEAASRVLTLNAASNHIYTSEERKMGAHLHNHIAHHTLALYSMGATPDQIIEHMKHNQSYQLLPPKLPDESVVKEMSTIEGYNRYLGNEDYFLDYTEFFENEIRDMGYEEVLQKYLCGGDARADDLLGRMYHGYVHSLMYVGMGLEFKQLPLVAEGLAQAAVHADMYYNEFFAAAERLAHEARETALPLSECLYHCHDYSSILTCSGPEYHHQMQPNGMWFVTKEMVRDGVCAKAFDDMARVSARYRVDPDDLERATAELINATVLMSAGAQHPPHECRYDFFLIHCTNAAIWHSCFLIEASLTNQQKARLLEYTGRLTLMMYAAMGCPRLDMDWVLSHSPHGVKMDWPRVFERACEHKDDGHMAKLIRAIKHAEEVSKSFDHLAEFQVKQHMFLPAAVAAVDSFSDVPMIGIAHFDLVRGAGYAQQWEGVPMRACNGNDASVDSLKI